MYRNIIILLAGILALTACTEEPAAQDSPNMIEFKPIPVEYPVTRKETVEDNYHGTVVQDPYRWLEDDESEATAAWVKAQNEATFGYLEQIPYRDKIKARLEEVWNYPKQSAPFREGNNYFFYKNDGLQNQAVLYKMDDLDSEPTIFLDPNSFSEDGTASLTTFQVSKDGRYAAFGISEGGSDWNEYFVLDVETGRRLGDHIQWIKFSTAAWRGDGFYYGRFAAPEEGKELSSQNEHKKIYYHRLGTDQSEDELVYEEPAHPRRGIYASTSEDERFLLIYMTEGATNDNALRIRDLGNPGSPMVDISTSFEHSYDFVDNMGDKLYILTNDGAPRRRLMAVDFNKPGRDHWVEVIPEREEVLQGVDLIGGKLYASYLKDASAKVYAYSPEGEFQEEVKLPGIGTVSGFSGKKDAPEAFYTFTSYTYPSTIFRFNSEDNSSEIFKKSEAKFNPDEYVTTEDFYKSKDGTPVHMFIVHKKGLELNGQNPCLLYGYGGFNINILPGFSTSNIVLLENGGVYAVANLRGGGEFGEEWHKGGMLDQKQNVFDDFIYAAEYLIEKGYTSKEKLGIHGRSNGGLLVGACMTQRPDLFQVALPGVGVLDMLRYHKFTIGHAWAVEYGSSDDAEQFKTLYAYSPLHNLKDGVDYPATMITTADHDDRVVPAHSFKFAARLQEAHAGEDPVLVRIDTKAGHGAGKPTSMIIEEQADIWSFLFYNTHTNVIY